METAVRSTGLLRRTIEFFFPPAVSTLQELHDFITGEASYLAQKTVVGYCRVKTMLDFDKLLTEPAFREGYDITRWEGYAGALGDSLILLEGLLRAFPRERRAAAVIVTDAQTRRTQGNDMLIAENWGVMLLVPALQTNHYGQNRNKQQV